jgi:hypothetical protein
MLLIEIQHTFKQAKTPINGMLPNNSKLNAFDTGIQAIAHLHQKFPNKIIKTVQISGKDDPSLAFARVCMNHQDNPYFPKIYHLKIYPMPKDMDSFEYEQQFSKEYEGLYAPTKGKYVMVVVMEKLYSSVNHPDIARPLLLSLGMLTPSDQPHISQFSGKLTSVGNTADKFDTKQSRKQLNAAADPYFKQALRLLEPLFNKHHPDMHGGNWMIRMSPTPHIVFIDPISNENSND